MRVHLSFFAVLLLLVAPVRIALAQSAMQATPPPGPAPGLQTNDLSLNETRFPDAPPEYANLVLEAVREFNSGHWHEAMLLFARANELYPNARALRGVGLSAYENRSYVYAVQSLSAAVNDQRRPLTDALRASTQTSLQQALSFVVRVEIERMPADAVVRVGGAPAVFDEQGRLLLDPGEHDVSASAPDHHPLTQRVIAAAGRSTRLSFQLVPIHSAPPPPPPPPATESSTGIPTLAYVGYGVAAAGLIVGTITGVMALGKDGELEDACDDMRCPPQARDIRDSAATLATVADVSFVVALLGAVGGTLALVLDGDERPAASATARERGVQVAFEGTRVALRGAF